MSVRDREEAVIARLHSLAPHLDGEPDPAFRATTRARLVAMAAVRSPAPEPVSPLRRLLTEGAGAPARWRTRLTAGLAGAALGVTALATVVAVAADARPGDVLYGLKRGTEETKLALAGDARGEVLLDLASNRLDEVRALVDSGATALPAAGWSPTGETVLAAGADATLVVETLEVMDDQTAEGASWLTRRAVTTEQTGPLELLADWATEQSDGLAALRDDVPPAAADEVDDSLELLSQITVRVSGLDSALDCAAGPATAGADELGPVPALCLDGSTATAVPGDPGSTEGNAPTGAVPQVPPTGATDLPAPLPDPSVPSVGVPVPGVPGVTGVPGVPGGSGATTPGVPLPTASIPKVTLPSASVTLPKLSGSSAPVPSTGGTPLGTLDVCLGPIVIGEC